jgi:acetyl-CoA C-acetyltransferase
MLATDSIRLGESSVVIAGGMENMSLAPYLAPTARFGQRMGHAELRDMLLYDGLLDPYSGRHMGEITEDWVVQKDITRAEQDEYAARSYRLAQAAVQNGAFADELVAVVKKTRKGDVTITEDEEPFRGNVEKLPELRAAFRKDGRITAGRSIAMISSRWRGLFHRQPTA